MDTKDFLYENIEQIINMSNAILEKYPTGRSEELDSELQQLWNAMDSYLIEYGKRLEGKHFGKKFDSERLFANENEEHPIVIASTAYYAQNNLETLKDEETPTNVWWYYNKEGEPDNTYCLLEHYFPSNSNVKQFIETGHIKFDKEAIKGVLEKYASLLNTMTVEESIEVFKQKEKMEKNKEFIYCVYDSYYINYYPNDVTERDNNASEDIPVPMLITKNKEKAEALEKMLYDKVVSDDERERVTRCPYTRKKILYGTSKNGSQNRYYLINDTDIDQHPGAYIDAYANRKECEKRLELLSKATKVLVENSDNRIYYDEYGNLTVNLLLADPDEPDAILTYEDGKVYDVTALPGQRTVMHEDKSLTDELDRMFPEKGKPLVYPIGETDSFKKAVSELATNHEDTVGSINEIIADIKESSREEKEEEKEEGKEEI